MINFIIISLMTEKQEKHEDQLITAVTQKLSPYSNYQLILVCLFSLLQIEICFMAMIGSFVFMNPLFSCGGEDVSEAFACSQLSNCQIINSYTGTYHQSLYCDRQSDREYIQSAYFFGNIFGMLLVSIVSDSKGRRMPMILCLITAVITCSFITIGIYTNSFFLMFVGQIFNGFVGSGMVVLGYVYMSEFCSNSHRQIGMMAIMISWSLGYAIFFVIYYLIPEWYNFMILLIIIPLIGLTALFYIFLFQTPIYQLLNQKDRIGFEKTLRMIAVFNKAQPQAVEKSIEAGNAILQGYEASMQKIEQVTVKTVFIEMIKVKANLKSVLLITLLYSAYNIEYFGAQMCFERIGLNYGTTLLSVGISELLVNLALSFFVQRIPRKKAIFSTIVLGAILGLLFALPSVENSLVTQIIIVILYRGCSICFSTFVIFCQTQSFNSTIRSTAIGLTSSVGKVINIFIPFIVTWLNDINIHPLVGLTIIYLVLSIPSSIFVKQTVHQHDQPETTTAFNSEKKGLLAANEETPLQG